MASKLTRLTRKIVIQLHLVAESCIISINRSRRPVRKLLDTTSHFTSEQEKAARVAIQDGNNRFHEILIILKVVSFINRLMGRIFLN